MLPGHRGRRGRGTKAVTKATCRAASWKFRLSVVKESSRHQGWQEEESGPREWAVGCRPRRSTSWRRGFASAMLHTASAQCFFFLANRPRILRTQTQSGQGAENIRKATSFRGGEGGERDRDETGRVRNDFVEKGGALVWIRTVRIAVRLRLRRGMERANAVAAAARDNWTWNLQGGLAGLDGFGIIGCFGRGAELGRGAASRERKGGKRRFGAGATHRRHFAPSNYGNLRAVRSTQILPE